MRDLARIARLALPQWRWVLLGILLSAATTLAHIGLLALSSWFIASMAIAGMLGVVMNYTTPAAGVRALAIARAGGRYAERLVNHDTTFRILAALRVWFFKSVEPLAPAALQLERSGDLLSRARADIDTLDDFYVRGVVPSIAAVLCAALLFLFLARFDLGLALADLAGLACAGALVPMLIARSSRRPGRERVERAADLRACIVEQVQGMAELEALGAGDFQKARVVSAEGEMDRGQRRLSSLQGMAEAQIVAFSTLAVGAAALMLAARVSRGELPGPDMAMLTVVVLASFETIMPLPSVLQRLAEMTSAARRLFQIIDQKPRVTEPVPASRDACPADVALYRVDLVIRDLQFRYSSDLPWVLRGLSLDVPAGSRLGVAGPTGAGKSTLVSVLLRFWEYEGGSVRVVLHEPLGLVEAELRSMGNEKARRLFSVVPQSPHLFHASIRDNLLIADARAQEEELWSALEASALADFVSSLPQGLDTLVGETGREISGGEAQRLAVARALLREAPVYILDEPTEGLDDRTAERLLASIDERLRGRSVLIISHRARDLVLVDAIHRMHVLDERSA